MNTTRKNKFLAIILAAMLLFTAMSATAFAADVEISTAEQFAAFINRTGDFASETDYSGKTIVLSNTIDMNNATLQGYTTAPFRGTFNGQNYIVKNFTVQKPLFAIVGYTGVIKNVTLENVTLTNDTEDARLGIVCSNLNGTLENVTIKNGTVNSSVKAGVIGALGAMTQNNATVKNCVVDGFIANAPQGAVAIGGAFGIMIGNENTTVDGLTVSDVAFNTTTDTACGTLKGTEQTADIPANNITNTTVESLGVATVSNSNNTKTVKCTSLAAAVVAAQDGDTVTLLQNTSGDGIQVPADKFNTTGLTINLNGYTYTISGKLVGSSTTETNGMQILDGNIVTIQNGTITSTKTAVWGDTTNNDEKNPKGLTGARILIMNYATLNLTGVTLDGTNLQEQDNKDDNPYIAHYPITLCNNRATTTVTNCTIKAKGENIGAALDTDKSNSGTSSVIVIGSNVNGLVYVWDNDSSITAKATANDETSTTNGKGYYRIANNKITKLNETYTITFDLDGGTLNGIGDPARYVFACGDKITLSTYVPTKPGYTFLGWFCYQEKANPDGSVAASINNDTNFNNPYMELVQITVLEVNRPVTIYAQWAQNTGGHSSKTYYNVMFDSNGGTKVATQSVRKNNTAEEPTAPTKSGYTFAGWFTDSKLTTAFDFDTKITKATKLYAKWTENTTDDTPGTDGTKTNTIILTLDSTTAIVFGETKQNDVAPLAIAGRVMMPTRFVAENLFCTVHWDKATGIIKIKGTHFTSGEEIVITLTVGSSIATVNGETVKLDSTTFVQDNRIYTPLRFIAETLGATVDWNSSTKKITITLPATKIVEDIMAATDDAE